MSSGKIGLIVEGDGEFHAAQTLLARALLHLGRTDVFPGLIQNAGGRTKLLRPQGLEKFVERAYREPGHAAVLVLLDSEGACPVEVARELSARIASQGARFPTAIVIAHRMYEVWFVACAPVLVGKQLRDRPPFKSVPLPANPEEVRDPKSWIDKQMPRNQPYKETEDQLLLTRLIDFPMAQTNSRSFARLLHAVEELLKAIDNSERIVTPAA